MGRRLPVLSGAPAAARGAPEEGADPAQLAREGWERRFMAAGERVGETVALYRELGYEVRVEQPTAAELREECGDCHVALSLFRVVYTRRSP